MRNASLLVAFLVSVTAVSAAENQAYLAIFADTQIMRIPGMPQLPSPPPGVDPARRPGAAAIQQMQAPQHSLTVRLWSPGVAPDDARAALTPPPGLRLGNRVDLQIYRPKPEDATAWAGPGGPADFTIEMYWGSSEKTREGQPLVWQWSKLTDDQRRAMREVARHAARQSVFYKPDWTTAYWPSPDQGMFPGAGIRLPREATLAGTYTLTTSYAGTASIMVPNALDFLPPLELTSPSLDRAPRLTDPIRLQWKPVPGVLAYHATLTGFENRNTMVIWSSSEGPPEEGAGVHEFLAPSQIEEYVKKGLLMDPKHQEVIVPAGILQDCRMLFLRLIGFGPGVTLAEGQPLPRVQTRTVLSVVFRAGRVEEETGPELQRQ